MNIRERKPRLPAGLVHPYRFLCQSCIPVFAASWFNGGGGPRDGRSGRLHAEAEADLLKQIDALRQTAKDQIAPTMEKIKSDAKALIDQAVADGKITQEQADRLLKQGRRGERDGMGHGGFGPRGPKGEGAKPDLDQLVKDGKITQAEADLHKEMDALRDASMEKTQTEMKAMVDQAVADGKITQEQADQLLNHGGRGGMGHGPMGPRGGKGR